MTTWADLGGDQRVLGRYAVPGDTRWSLCHPSIGWSPEDGYRVTYISSNHYLLTDGSTMLTFGERRYRKLFYEQLSDGLEKLDEPRKLLVSSYRDSSTKVPVVKGVEDVRVFWRPEGWRLLGTFTEQEPILALGVWGSGQEPVWSAIKRPKRAGELEWVPAAYGGSDLWDYLLSDARVVFERGIKKVGATPEALEHFYGGPPVVPLEDGTFLGLPYMREIEGVRVYTASRMAYINGTNDRYSHRFVRYAEDGAPIEASEPFVFESWGVEKAAGLVHWGDDFVVAWGRNDVSSLLGRISQRKVLKLLKKV